MYFKLFQFLTDFIAFYNECNLLIWFVSKKCKDTWNKYFVEHFDTFLPNKSNGID